MAHVGRRVESLKKASNYALTLTNQVRLIDPTPGQRTPADIEADDLHSLIQGVIREASDPSFSESGLREEIGAAITQKGKVIGQLPRILGLSFLTVFLPLEQLDIDLSEARGFHKKAPILAALKHGREQKRELETRLGRAPGPRSPKLTPISANFIESESKTVYTEAVTDPDKRGITYRWVLTEHNDPSCVRSTGAPPLRPARVCGPIRPYGTTLSKTAATTSWRVRMATTARSRCTSRTESFSVR